MELRRRQKEEKRAATETKIAEITKKMKEQEEQEQQKSRKKEVWLERAVPLCVGLAMLVTGLVGYCYTR